MSIEAANLEILKHGRTLVAGGETIRQLIKELESNTVKDTNLNQQMQRAKSQNQNLRPLYLQARAILLERSNLFTKLATTTKTAADLCQNRKTGIDQMTKIGGAL